MAPKYQLWRLVCRDCYEAQSPMAWEYQLPLSCACGGDLLHRDTGIAVSTSLVKFTDEEEALASKPYTPYVSQFTKNSEDINIYFE